MERQRRGNQTWNGEDDDRFCDYNWGVRRQVASRGQTECVTGTEDNERE